MLRHRPETLDRSRPLQDTVRSGLDPERADPAHRIEEGRRRHVICDVCGETNKAGTEFCAFCGAYLGWQLQDNPPAPDSPSRPLPAGEATGAAPGRTQAAHQAGPTSAPPTPPPAPSPAQAPPSPAPPATPLASEPGPWHEPSPLHVGQQSAPTAPPAPAGCPTCGRPVETGRRFCGHCGEQLVRPGAGAPITRPTTKRDTWWSRLWDSEDRAARRAYRRSLPPLYRWRRVITAVLAVGLISAGLTMIGRSPTAFVLARYYDLRGTLVNVPGVRAAIIPPDASAQGTPDLLVDRTTNAWLMSWSSTTAGSTCGETPTTAVIQLSFEPTRIRGIDLWAGMLTSDPNRLQQFRPETIWVAYADQCREVRLQDVERQPVALDTGIPVDSLLIGVVTAFQPGQPGGSDVLGFTEITLRARPAVG